MTSASHIIFGMNENELDKQVDLVERLTKLFVEEYQVWHHCIAGYMDCLDDSEQRRLYLQAFPQLSRLVEGHTREELAERLEPLAMGAACALTVVAAHTALHHKGSE